MSVTDAAPTAADPRPTAAAAPPAGDTAEAPEPAPPTLLFVDDEPSILSALRRLFRPQGYRVLTAEGGEAALALLAAESVDLVISDMRMPVMDGVQFLEQVRARHPQVVRVMLTGYADITSTIGAINRGEIHRYISKPWDEQDILLSVHEGLQRQKLERENAALSALTRQQNTELQEVNGQLQQVNIQLQAASDQLTQTNLKLAEANTELSSMNQTLERRVSERTAELEASHDQLALKVAELDAAHAQMAAANGKLEAANAQLEENFGLSISVFAGLLELRDGRTAGHGHRVAEIARRTGEKLGLRGIELTDIHNAGLLHAVGKIGLPDALINKTVSTMNGAEFALYRRHPVQGQAALAPLGRLRQSAILIRSQHERVDGQGFPDGLRGAEVPLGAQIIGAAATFEGLMSGLLAEKEYSTEDAFKAVQAAVGTHYEAEVVEAMAVVLKEMAAELLADLEVTVDALKSGMVLSREVRSPHGSVLLPAGFAFTSGVIQQMQRFIQKNEVPMSFFVKLPDEKKPGRR